MTTAKPLKSENLVEVDAELAFILEELNKKGYKTKYSCEGHWLTKSQYVSATAEISTPFIMFEDGIKLPSCPAHWRKEIHIQTIRLKPRPFMGRFYFIPDFRCNVQS